MHFFRSFSLAAASPNERGFSMIELLVSIAIMVLITTALVIQGTDSRGELELTNHAYDMALLVREAQVFGTAVRGEDIGTTDFTLNYGVVADTADPFRLVLFRDDDQDARFDSGEFVKEVILPPGNEIDQICAGADCSNTSNLSTPTVTFMRPALEARITGFTNGVASTHSSASIRLLSRNGTLRNILILSTGQISVE